MVAVVYFLGGRAAAPAANAIAGDIAKVRRLYDGCHEKSGVHFQQEQERIQNEFEETKRALNQEWKDAARNIGQLRGAQPVALGEQASRLAQKNLQWRQAELERIQQRHAENVARLKAEDRERVRQIAETHEARLAQIKGEEQLRWQALAAEWNRPFSRCATSFAPSTIRRENFFRRGIRPNGKTGRHRKVF